MEIKEQKRRIYIILFIIIATCNCLMFFVFNGKEQLHIDEVFSYGLSNSYGKPFLFIYQIGLGEPDSESRTYKCEPGEEDPFYRDKSNSFYEQWHSGEDFKKYITVQEGERFKYDNVYNNQVCDIHPPMYYFLLHTICSFFPDTFSNWYAASLNLFLYSLSILVLFLIGQLVLKSDKKALLAAAVWALSRGGISNAAFFRMYMLMTLLTLLLVYFHLRLLENYKIKYIILIFAVNVTGFLTQYYFYIFSFFLTAAVCFYFLFKRRIKHLAIYAFSVLASVGTALLVYPASIIHTMQGTYTGTTINGFKKIFEYNPLLVYILQDYTGLTSVENTLAADLLPIVLVIVALILWLWICRKKIDIKEIIRKKLSDLPVGYTVLIISSAVSGYVTAAICPYMMFFYDRYIFSLLPLFALPIVSIVCFLTNILTKKIKKQKFAFTSAVAVFIVFTVLSNTLTENKYLGRSQNTAEVNNTAEEIFDGGTFYYAAENECRIHNFAPEFINAEKVYPAHKLSDSLIKMINDNEIKAETAYLIVEAQTERFNDTYVPTNKTQTEYILKEKLKHEYEFVADYYCGYVIYGELFYMYKINYK